MIRVLFICLGNICRSPSAEGVFRQLVVQKNLQHVIHIDSAGTSDWHLGSAPDSRSIAAAKKRGIDLSCLQGRQVQEQDFFDHDYVIAMDRKNVVELLRVAPVEFRHKIFLMSHFAKQNIFSEDVPDPYFGEEDGFELVLNQLEDASEGLFEYLFLQHPKLFS